MFIGSHSVVSFLALHSESGVHNFCPYAVSPYLKNSLCNFHSSRRHLQSACLSDQQSQNQKLFSLPSWMTKKITKFLFYLN